MKTSLFTFIVLAVICCSVGAVDVIYGGKKPISAHQIERLINETDAGNDSIQADLRDDGYLDAIVAEKDGRVVVSAGPRYLLDTVICNSIAIKVIGIEQPFTKSNIENVFEALLQKHRDSGYFYCSARVENITRTGNRVRMHMTIDRGPLVRIESTHLTGLSRTSPELVKRYLPVSSGEPLTEENIVAAEKGAASVPFVVFEPPARIRPLPGYTNADLELAFSEKKQVLFEGGGGYVPNTSTGLVWNLNLRFQNLFGTGRQIRLLSEHRENDRQLLEVEYRQPVFIWGIGSAAVNVATRDYRDQFYEFSTGVSYRARLNMSFGSALSLGWRSVEPAGEIPSYQSFSSNISIERGTLDDPLNPSAGYAVSWTIGYSYRRYSGDSLELKTERGSFNETRNFVQLEWYRNIGRRLLTHVRLNYEGLETGESLPPISELFFIGGPPSIRGYRNEQFTGVRSAFGTIEPRLRFDGGHVFLFYDGAYINNRIPAENGRVVTDEFYKYSYGFGATIIDKHRSIKLSLGWNPEAAYDQPRLSIEFSSEI